MMRTLKIDGMGCEHCIKSVREALEEIEGLNIIKVDLGLVEVDADDKMLEIIKEKLDEVGYEVIE